jgi:tRNA modification GTPase
MAGRDAAIVSPIAGTTRDRIEAPVVRDGLAWLLIDTAGLAESTDDAIEAIGIERARDAIAGADIVLWLGDDAPLAGAIAVHPRLDAPGRDRVPEGRIGVSAVSGIGLDNLWSAMAAKSQALLPSLDLPALNQRQRGWIAIAAESLRLAEREQDDLLLAEHLRSARVAFDRLTGTADVESMLDALFGRFCIGK